MALVMDKALFTLIVKFLGEPGYYRGFKRVMAERFRNVEAMANVDRIWAECAAWYFDHINEISFNDFIETRLPASQLFDARHRSP